MASFRQTIANALAANRTLTGVAVTYQRGESSVSLTATRGRTEFETDDGAGMPLSYESADWLVSAADLVIGGERIEPRQGDKVTDGGKVYEVLAPRGEPVWRWRDGGRSQMRIHSKLTDNG